MAGGMSTPRNPSAVTGAARAARPHPFPYARVGACLTNLTRASRNALRNACETGLWYPKT